MTGFNHTLAGSIIALMVPAPLVPLVAFLSHFTLDALPHFGRSQRFSPFTRDFKLLLVADAILCFSALFFAWWLFPDKWLIISVGAFFSALPDFMWLLRGRVAWLKGFFWFASVIQWGERSWGWVLEIIYGALMVTALLMLSISSLNS